MKKSFSKIILLALDTISIVLALGLSFYLSGDFLFESDLVWPWVICAAIIIKISIFIRAGLYRAVLRYASLEFLAAVMKAVSLSSLGLIFVLYITKVHLNPKILVLDWLLTIFLIGGCRFAGRYYIEIIRKFKRGRRVLIYGAGELGVMALRQLRKNNKILYSPVGFMDDDANKRGKTIHGVEVFGTMEDLDRVIEDTNSEELVVAIAEIDSDRLRDIVKRCRQKKVFCRIMPCFSKLMEFEPMMRGVEISDLIRRPPRNLDMTLIDRFIYGKRVLVTGAAGSIGSELVRQCLQHNPSEVIVVDQSENGLYTLQEELSGEDRVKYVLCDVTSFETLSNIFDLHRPHIVFHAAAYKHVPMLEGNITQAIINNIEGTRVLAEVAEEYGVDKFVLISTDKAVNPSSVMGTTKRVCELFIQNFNKKSKTEFVAVRFGNVLGSSGSVIPKFVDQIRNGNPVTVTHPEATRYFMLVSEAVQLVLQAAAIGGGGNIFILDMGKPVKIVEMAEDLIFLMGKEPYKDVDIVFTGMRPGEKIHEELFSEEIEDKTQYDNITVAKATLLDCDWLSGKIKELVAEALNGNVNADMGILKEIISNGSDLSSEGKVVPFETFTEDHSSHVET